MGNASVASHAAYRNLIGLDDAITLAAAAPWRWPGLQLAIVRFLSVCGCPMDSCSRRDAARLSLAATSAGAVWTGSPTLLVRGLVGIPRSRYIAWQRRVTYLYEMGEDEP